MTTITHNKRTFDIIEKQPISMYPNLAQQRPDAEFFFIAVGKKGATIDGFILKNGSLIIF